MGDCGEISRCGDIAVGGGRPPGSASSASGPVVLPPAHHQRHLCRCSARAGAGATRRPTTAPSGSSASVGRRFQTGTAREQRRRLRPRARDVEPRQQRRSTLRYQHQPHSFQDSIRPCGGWCRNFRSGRIYRTSSASLDRLGTASTRIRLNAAHKGSTWSPGARWRLRAPCPWSGLLSNSICASKKCLNA